MIRYMLTRVLFFVLVLHIFFGLGACTKKEAPRNFRIGIIGDSITGVGTHEGFGMWARFNGMIFYPEFLEEIVEGDPRFEILTVNPQAGSRASSGPKRVRAMLSQHEIDLLIFELGANDLLKGGNPQKAAKAIVSSIEIALKKKIQVVLIGMQNADYRQGKQFDLAAKALEGREGFYYLPNFFEGLDKDDFHYTGGVPHPTKAAQEIIAAQLHDFLDQSYATMILQE